MIRKILRWMFGEKALELTQEEKDELMKIAIRRSSRHIVTAMIMCGYTNGASCKVVDTVTGDQYFFQVNKIKSTNE